MEKNINSNGYDYVDLELPSGTLWATCNVGASKPSETGLYFQWGDTQGYTDEQVGFGEGKKTFLWHDYKFSIDGIPSNFIKYTTPGTMLELEDDAAHVNMGGDWHMPTPDQILELITTTNTASKWVTQDDVIGRLFTSKKDTSKSIFIPAIGYAWNGSVSNIGHCGYIWSSMLSDSRVISGQHLFFGLGGYGLYNEYGRCDGFSVRGVIG